MKKGDIVRFVTDQSGDTPVSLVGRKARLLRRCPEQDEPHFGDIGMYRAWQVVFEGQKKRRVLWDDEFEKVDCKGKKTAKKPKKEDVLDDLLHQDRLPSMLKAMRDCLDTIEQVMARAADEIERLRKEVRKQ